MAIRYFHHNLSLADPVTDFIIIIIKFALVLVTCYQSKHVWDYPFILLLWKRERKNLLDLRPTTINIQMKLIRLPSPTVDNRHPSLCSLPLSSNQVYCFWHLELVDPEITTSLLFVSNIFGCGFSSSSSCPFGLHDPRFFILMLFSSKGVGKQQTALDWLVFDKVFCQQCYNATCNMIWSGRRINEIWMNVPSLGIGQCFII